jgi:hypothetical protein
VLVLSGAGGVARDAQPASAATVSSHTMLRNGRFII